MTKKYVKFPIWKDTHKKIKLQATMQGKNINQFLDDMFENEIIDKKKQKPKFKFQW